MTGRRSSSFSRSAPARLKLIGEDATGSGWQGRMPSGARSPSVSPWANSNLTPAGVQERSVNPRYPVDTSYDDAIV